MTLDYRVGYYQRSNESVTVSPWHDVGLFPTPADAAAAADAIISAAKDVVAKCPPTAAATNGVGRGRRRLTPGYRS